MASDYDVTALQAISQGNNYFCYDLYKVLAAESGNLFFSPISVQIILALLYFGTKGNTAKELASSLYLPDNNKKIEDGFTTLLNGLKDASGINLDIASKIYAQTSFHIKDEFRASAEHFLAETEELDFASATEESRVAINGWVEEKTNNKIKNLIPPGVLSAMTRLVLANAVYFKGNWSTEFNKRSTLPRLFHLSSNETKFVDTMFIKDSFHYSDLEGLQAQAIALPYKGEQISMVILLPKKVNNITELEEKLSDIRLPEILSQMQKTDVYLYLPKFTLQYEKELVQSLQKLGVTSAFSNEADLSGVSDSSKGLAVSNVLHKAFIEVNEEGTEAAAATGSVVVLTSLWEEATPVVFKADHPFMFFIIDNQTKAVLFAGRYSVPV